MARMTRCTQVPLGRLYAGMSQQVIEGVIWKLAFPFCGIRICFEATLRIGMPLLKWVLATNSIRTGMLLLSSSIFRTARRGLQTKVSMRWLSVSALHSEGSSQPLHSANVGETLSSQVTARQCLYSGRNSSQFKHSSLESTAQGDRWTEREMNERLQAMAHNL